MKIKDVETATGLTRANIRFYEKEGLFQPDRSENNYRAYSESDVETLKKIALLRKLGISIEDLKGLLGGTTPLQEALSTTQTQLEKEISQLQGAIRLCGELQRNQETMETLQADRYLPEVDKLTQNRLRFPGFTEDTLEHYKQDVLLDWLMAFPIRGKLIWSVLLLLTLLGSILAVQSALAGGSLLRCVVSFAAPALILLVYTLLYPLYDQLSVRGKRLAVLGWALVLMFGILAALLWSVGR